MTGESHAIDADHELLPEFDPRLDLIAPVFGVIGLFGAAAFVGGDYALSLARLLVGAAFLGAVSDAMLLGHCPMRLLRCHENESSQTSRAEPSAP